MKIGLKLIDLFGSTSIFVEITNKTDLVFLEDLRANNLTSSANRVILDSGWGKLEQFIRKKAVVHKIDTKYTSQKCSECGHIPKDDRTTQSKFKCAT